MPTIPQEAWFNPTYYAQQKVLQMNTTGYLMKDGEWLAVNGNGATEWTVELYNKYIGETKFDGATVSPWENFLVCNGGNEYYNVNPTDTKVTLQDINVSPNQYFNIPEYLQALADFNNANPSVYPGTPPAGGWTAQTELDAIFNQYHTSVWNHYNNNWYQVISKDADGAVTNYEILNPSNAFDALAYITKRAEASKMTVDQYVQKLLDAGTDPLRDFYDPQGGNQDAALVSRVTAGAANPPAGWVQWPGTAPVVEPDPYDVDVTPVPISADVLNYPAEGEEYSGNTRFEGVWGQTHSRNTLNAQDVITGPEGALNTLAVTLGKNWNGFGTHADANGDMVDNVQNVGRVVLNHDPVNIVKSWNFDASGISKDAERFDLNGGNGPGAINLANLKEGVNDIRISNLTPKDVNGVPPDTTYIDYEVGANGGNNNALKIQLDNVGGGGSAAAKIASKTNFGIEELTLDTVKNGDSFVDLTGLTGIRTLKFDGEGNTTVTNVATGIRTYDASAATGNVNMAIVDPIGSTVVKGGAGNDTVTLNSGSWKPLGLENIENLTLTGAASVNLANVTDGVLQDINISTAGGQITNATADVLKVHLRNGTTQAVTVNGDRDGSLQNVIFDTPDRPTPGSDSVVSLVTNADNKITFEPGENVTKFEIGTFSGDAANELVVNAGAINFAGGSLKALQVLDLNLEGTDSSVFSIDLPSIQNITIDGGGKDMTMSCDLGGARHQAAIDMTVENVAAFTLGDTTTGRGDTITFNIDATGEVNLGAITNTTTLNTSLQGAVNLTVSGANVNSGAAMSIDGGPLRLNFDGVDGQVASNSANALNLESTGNIQYIGAQGKDYVVVQEIGSDGSNFAPGIGEDWISFSGTAAQGLTKVNMDLADGEADTINLAAQTKGSLYLTLTDYDSTDVLSGGCKTEFSDITNTQSATVINLLERFDIVQDGYLTNANVGSLVTKGATDGTFVYGGTVFATDAASTTVLINLGSVDEYAGIAIS